MKKRVIQRILAGLMSAALLCGMIGCGKDEDSRRDRDRDREEEEEDEEDDGDTADKDDNGGTGKGDGAGTDLPTVMPENDAPQAEWEGDYLTDSWAENQGTIHVELDSDNYIHFYVKVGDVDEEFVGTEQNYEMSEYDWGKSEHADCNTRPEGKEDGDMGPEFNFNHDEDSPAYLSIYYSLGGIYGETLQKFTGWHVAPENYEDEDWYGYISEEFPGDKDYFQKTTDDYRIRFYLNDSCWDGNDSIPAQSSELYCYDDNGLLVTRSVRYVFEDEASAKRAYEYESKYDSDSSKYYLVGNVMYYNELYLDYLPNDYKTETSDFYLGCHYYDASYDKDNISYTYFSKPITEDIYRLGIEDVVFFNGLPDGEFYCTDTKDVTMNINMTDYSSDLYVYDYGDDEDNQMKSNYGYTVVDGDHITVISTFMEYYPEEAYFTFVREYDFSAGTEVTVVEYTYRVNDPHACEITLDNYSSKTPDKTVTHTFDLTRVKTN